MRGGAASPARAARSRNERPARAGAPRPSAPPDPRAEAFRSPLTSCLLLAQSPEVRRMEWRQLGRSGLRVSALSLGAMTFGEAQGFMKGVGSDDAEARRVLDAALDAGLDTVDTANGYAEGKSEELLGRWLEGRRQRVTLATKVRFPTL